MKRLKQIREQTLNEGAHDFRAKFDLKTHPTVQHVEQAIRNAHRGHEKRGPGGAYDEDTQLAKVTVKHVQTPHTDPHKIHDHHLDHTEKWGPLHAHKGETHWHVGGWVAESVIREDSGSQEVHGETQAHAPHTYLDQPHLVRLNTILTQVTAKLFLNLHVYVEAVRAALDFHGFKLPHLDCEQNTHGPNVGQAYGDILHGPGFEDNRNVAGVPNEFEYVFELVYDTVVPGTDPQEFLYMVASRVELAEDGHYWECYAQVVNKEELDELLSMDEDPRDFRMPTGDASGETDYLKLQRHANSTGVSPEVEAPE